MSAKLTIGLPVMLHSQPEIEAFLKAKDRIETYGNSIGTPLEVGAFLFFLPFAMKEANLAKQLENQEKYRLPIVHAQSTFQSRHCLAFSAEQDPDSCGKDFMDLVVNQTAALRKYDSVKHPVDVSVNVGLYIHQRALDPRNPVFFTPEEFPAYKDLLFQRSLAKFSQLESLAQRQNLGIAIENGIQAAVAVHPKLKDDGPGVFVHPFNDLESMVKISKGKLVFDTAHWAGTRSAPEFFDRNKAYDAREMIFTVEGIHSWNEYLARHPSLGEYLLYSRAFHICNATGPGIYLDEELTKKWGAVGISPEGLIPRDVFRELARHAEKNKLPLIIEVDYDIKNMETNQYREADPMIKHMLT